MGGVSGYSVKNFCRTLPKENVQESLSAPLISGVDKNFCIGGVSHDFLEGFLSHTTKKPRRGTLLCFKIFQVSKKIMDKKDGVDGISKFSL